MPFPFWRLFHIRGEAVGQPLNPALQILRSLSQPRDPLLKRVHQPRKGELNPLVDPAFDCRFPIPFRPLHGDAPLITQDKKQGCFVLCPLVFVLRVTHQV